ncbi:Fe(2+) transporter FeoB [Gammaproteobacteria bacterium]
MKHVALLGMPNTGKSTLFNRMTGASARVGNWPGVTVELLGARLLLGAEMVELVDLPGVYDLHGFTDDEMLVRHFLEHNPLDLVLIILNTTQIERQLSLALQIKHLGLPAVVLLNMADEARRLGIHVNTTEMAQLLEMPVVMISAKYGEGYATAQEAVRRALTQSHSLPLDDLCAGFGINRQIEAEMDQVLRATVDIPHQLPDSVTDRIDHFALHPVFGPPLFFGLMYLVFQGVFTLGKPLQDAIATLLQGFKGAVLTPLLNGSGLPSLLQGLLSDGIYDGVGTVASFVPLIVLFFLFMALVEDSGYLSRAAFLTDALMARLGLDGRSFVMLLMGFGCNVPALMGTRVMRSRPLRLLSMLVIPFSLCSARLQVFIFLTAALFGPTQAPLVLFGLYLMSFAAAFLTALLFRGAFRSQEPLALELPPYRLPTFRQMWLRGWLEIRHFLRRATSFIVLGVVMVWLLTHLPSDAIPASPATWAGHIGAALAPVLNPIGIDLHLALALIFGFVAKEIVIGSLAVIYGASGDALAGVMASQIDWVQGVSFMLFTLLYVPCLSTLATLRSESRSFSYTALSLAWSVGLAWVVSFVFYQTARWLGL